MTVAVARRGTWYAWLELPLGSLTHDPPLSPEEPIQGNQSPALLRPVERELPLEGFGVLLASADLGGGVQRAPWPGRCTRPSHRATGQPIPRS